MRSPAAAQDDAYPSRPITMVVLFPAAGSSDVIGRLVAEGLRQVLGAMFLMHETRKRQVT
jgi:tripartite-type tricarboxylate transporter receptor subunit TctC